ncbi:MAG: diguanylate cyclase [Frankiales bacterium]|nr:diguanylate cyclase [Frankiales bacterium]
MPPLILLADDSPTVRALAKLELEHAGYEVVEAGDGEETLRLARIRPPDVILLDVEMPQLDGYETVKALKSDPLTTHIPVVFLTGRVGPDDVVRALQLGGHDYLRKPPEPAELLARVGAALRVKQLQDELVARGDELERMSRTDFLTGLNNRRHLEEALRRVGAGAKRHGYPVAVLIIDVDHFKQINDTFGHSTGDEVLIATARRLEASLRTEDVLGRWGGEEFLVILPHTAADAAGVLAERLRGVVAGTPVRTRAGEVTFTISIGGAAAEQEGQHDLLRIADVELYAAKDAGRNSVRIVVSQP